MLTLQSSRIPQIRGVKDEAVVLYPEPLRIKEMRYPRIVKLILSRRDISEAKIIRKLDFRQKRARLKRLAFENQRNFGLLQVVPWFPK